MSTACQIDFIEKSSGKRRRIYCHFDGYPESIIPRLNEFLNWNERRNHDLDYKAANFILWVKLVEARYTSTPDDAENTKNRMLDGYGICDTQRINEFIDYFYEVINDGTKDVIKTYEVHDGKLAELEEPVVFTPPRV